MSSHADAPGHDDSDADRAELKREEDELAPEEVELEGWLPEPEPNDGPAPAP